MTDDLQPLAPRDGMEMWLDRMRTDRADETLQSYRYRLEQFVEWCDREEIENLNDLTGRDVYRFESDRRAEDLSPSTIQNQMGTVRQFIGFCAQIDAVDEDLPAKIELPSLTKHDRSNDTKLSVERAERILDKLGRYARASRDHAMFAVAWHTGCRLGGLRALDLEDCYLDEDDLDRIIHQDDVDEEILDAVEVPFLYFRDRPETDTTLKNKRDGERPVGLSEEIGSILQEYIDVNRVDTTDEHDRRPLFTTEKGNGRISKTGIRLRFNTITQPCRYGGGCPHGRDLDSCEALEHGREARCPSSRSPHPIRTGSITMHRDEGWPPEVLAERVNATPDVIRTHYDKPDQLRRMQSRRNYLDNQEDDL